MKPPKDGHRFRNADNSLDKWNQVKGRWIRIEEASDQPVIGRHGESKVVFDDERGYARLDPLPDAGAVAAYYEDDQFYEDHSPPDWLEKEQREYEAGLWDSYFEYLARVMRATDFNYMLDWGCGGGWFCRFWASRFEDVVMGLEPSARAREVFNRHNLPACLESEAPLVGGYDSKIDMISLQFVLEHTVEPVELLRNVRRFLKPWGRLLVTVPNDFNPLQKRVNYYGFISPVHVNYFTPATLRGVMEKAGFRIVHTGATFPMELFLLLGVDYRENDVLGRRCHEFRLRLEKVLGWRVFGLYGWLLRKWGWGREIICVGEKVNNG